MFFPSQRIITNEGRTTTESISGGSRNGVDYRNIQLAAPSLMNSEGVQKYIHARAEDAAMQWGTII